MPEACAEDLIAEGNQGLIVAVDRFDPITFDNRFSTFASAWIIRYIQRALHRATLVKTPKARPVQIASADARVGRRSSGAGFSRRVEKLRRKMVLDAENRL